MKKAKFKMTGNGSGMEEVSESSCLCASLLKKDAGVVEGDFNTETQRLRGTEFKMTEIGLIPEDWKVKRLGDVSSNFNYGVGAEAVPYIEGPRYIRITDIDENSHKFTPDQTVAAAFSDPNSIVNDGDILVARTGASVGKSYLYDKSDGDLIFAGFLMRFHPIEVISAYAYRQTLTGRYWQWIASESARSGQPGINIQQLKSFQIPVPPLPEQKAIADALSDVDELLAAMTTLIEKKRAIKQGAMQELLGIRSEGRGMRDEELGMRNFEVGAKKVPRRRLPGFSGEWKIVRIGEISKLVNGYAFKSKTYTDDGQFSIITIANVQDGKFILESVNKINDLPNDIQGHQILHKGDVIISMTGNVGRVCRVTQEKCLLNQRVGKFESIEIDTSFFYLSLRTKRFISTMIDKGQGGAQPNIGKYDISSYEIMVPPTLAEQKAIAEVLSDMDAEISELEAQKAKFESIKQGMMQELLTGKTRLLQVR